MAPPSTKPRLSTLTPDGVALEVAVATFQYTQQLVQTLLAPAYAGVRWHDSVQVEVLCRQTHVHEAVRQLAEYAIVGAGNAEVIAVARNLLRPLGATILRGLDVDESRANGVELDSALGVVFCAAEARARLQRMQPLTAVHLAALAGLSATQVRLLSRSGEIATHDGEVAAREARRWLTARRVAGVTNDTPMGAAAAVLT